LTPEPRPERHAGLVEILEEARDLGFLGPGPIAAQIDHAIGFGAAWLAHAPGPPRGLADLGAGGGIPGLALAAVWPDTSVVLVESMVKRAGFLARSAAALGWENVMVDERRAEVVGRDPHRRRSFDLVVARSFGPPALAAECGAPLLRPGGLLVVSEPPEPSDRWDEAGLAGLGLVAIGRFGAGASYMVLRQEGECPARYPRKAGIPAKRPLF
jgi:16S rRNA (guanine527-N7)-methyltransferase